MTDNETYFIDDQPITPMPTKCLKWECDKEPLIIENGFVVCPKCQGSYGRTEDIIDEDEDNV